MLSYHSISHITFINENEGKHIAQFLNHLCYYYHHHRFYYVDERRLRLRDYLKLKQQSHVLNLGSLTELTDCQIIGKVIGKVSCVFQTGALFTM